MDKRKSIWEVEQAAQEQKQRPVLKGAIKKDVIIIGGGMAGILTAYFLQKQGAHVAVLEAGRVGSGQTSHTMAKITYQHGMIYTWLTKKMGQQAAREYAQAGMQAIEDYETIIADEKIDCDFRRLPSYLYTKRSLSQLKAEAEAARNCGISCRIQTDTELPFSIKGALCFEGQAQFHPLKFLRAISEKLEIYENSPVIETSGTSLATPEGTAEGSAVIIATHFPFINFPGYYFLRMHQERSYVLALKQAQQLEGMYYGIDPETGWSMRCAGDRLLFGGAGHRTGIIPKQDPYSKLYEKAAAFWPDCQIAASWSAQDCMSSRKIPYVGAFSRNTQGIYVAAGFGKWGMTHSMAGARILSNEILGTARRKKTIFDPGKLDFFIAFPAIMKDAAISTKNLAASLAGARPKCSHLGCHLHWNLWENAWECQCHGSGFKEGGDPEEGPAQTKLDF